ncbi:MAG: prepilin-type N-terminal cleavage/methylation domain-containing protein [Candidatus Omnitrophota bacterium]
MCRTDVVGELASWRVGEFNPQTRELVNPRTKKGFTLIETLLVTSMLAVVSLAVYGTFNSGIKIWQRLTQRMPVEDVSILFEKMTDDLRNSFSFDGLPFIGLGQSFSCATLVNTKLQSGPEGLSAGKVVYFYNPKNKTINRQQFNYSEIYEDVFTRSRQMSEQVYSLRFQYYYYDPLRRVHGWKELWLEEDEEARLPLAVRMTISFMENEEIREETKTIALPCATQYHYE